MAPSPPSFSSQTYWDARFTREPSPFEWLQEPEVFRDALQTAIGQYRSTQAQHTADPRILHIGCGTSGVSLYLRSLVAQPSSVHNTDFSPVAVRLGRAREAERARAEQTPRQAGDDNAHTMQWSTLDLLDLGHVQSLLRGPDTDTTNTGPGTYDIIVDKSTCDAIACGEDIAVEGPGALQVILGDQERELSHSTLPSPASAPAPQDSTATSIHPLHILAQHLALVARPGCRWLALSYSQSRFPWEAPEEAGIPARMLAQGFVHPRQLWTLERAVDMDMDMDMDTVVAPAPATQARAKAAASRGAQPRSEANKHQQTPRIVHTLYVLRRSQLRVCVRGSARVGMEPDWRDGIVPVHA